MINEFTMHLRISVIFLAIASIILLAPKLRAQEIKQSTAPTAALPSLDAIKTCMDSRQSAECLDKLFRDALKNHSTLDILQMVQRFEAEDSEFRRDCHPVVHAIGRETYRLKGNIHDSFSACDQTCHSGCYHGSVERFLRGDNIYAEVDKHPSTAELKQKAVDACDPKIPFRLRFQCLHGLGHALLFFSRYQLVQSLAVCDVLPDSWSQSSCYGGVFMENVFNTTPETRDLSPSDYHYPCSKLAAKYRSECYVMQTSRMTEMGLSTDEVFQECGKAGAFRDFCATSIGRDLSNEARLGNTRATAEKCELALGSDRLACTRGVVYALIDNTWDGRYALPFCATFRQDTDQDACFRLSAQYLQSTFEKSSAEIGKDCVSQLSQPSRCVESMAR
ncbi:MAG TPA: hypothetical protein VK632_04560 [Verrucomicrobiae bacterium]|nr:hypothetical protein [Verrucomicrobiae bacterium]